MNLGFLVAARVAVVSFIHITRNPSVAGLVVEVACSTHSAFIGADKVPRLRCLSTSSACSSVLPKAYSAPWKVTALGGVALDVRRVVLGLADLGLILDCDPIWHIRVVECAIVLSALLVNECFIHTQ